MSTIRQHRLDISESQQNSLVDFAIELIRADYYTSVQSLAESLIDEIKAGDIKDREALDERVHQDVDGSSWIIYTQKAKLVLLVSDNEDEAEEQGLEAHTPEQRAFWAMRADLEQQLQAESVDDLFEED